MLASARRPAERRIGRERRRARRGGRRAPASARADAVGDRGAQPVAGGGDRVGIDVAADLAGDVGLARQLQHLGAEGRLERLVLGDLAERVDERRVDRDGLARARPRRSPAISVAHWRASAPPASD